MKILLAVDGSSYTKHMLAYLAAHEEWLVAANEFTVLYGLTPLPNGLAALLSDAVVKARYDTEADAVFKPIRTFLDMHAIDAKYVHRVGDAGKLVAQLADEGGFDLVMLGSHGHGALGNVVLGSVATKVLAQCKVPVLIVRG
jgi:nucleotide-binding universal stress UspA family protein